MVQSQLRLQQGSEEGSGDRFREALVQSQVRFNRVPEKVPERVWKSVVKSQVRFNRVAGEGSKEPLLKLLLDNQL